MEGQGARLVPEVGSLCLETIHVLEMEEETERAKEADRGMGAGRRGGGGACGLDFSAPPPPPTPHSPVPQILSWGPQGRSAVQLPRPPCVQPGGRVPLTVFFLGPRWRWLLLSILLLLLFLQDKERVRAWA